MSLKGVAFFLLKGVAELSKNATSLLKLASAVYFFQKNVGELMLCVGPSMLPTLSANGDVVIMEHFTPRFRELKRKDIVVAVSPLNPNMSVCKRVTGLEGDKLVVGQATAEAVFQIHPEIVERTEYGSFVRVPSGHVWLEGDNAINSTDSRQYGPVSVSLIRGRVLCRVLPLNAAGRVD
ncbi:similar to mitochondrial inner membrane protease IMP1 [Cyanidioschyzon merolae strain 10D]|jgi:inner membrane protease subunit 1|uniref:Mitochondrial inner membrane protease subunit n=1 Tax=Cyanidioschyzon merolae (strain NIES-3377 / 10D) TaxID=280699 RepID=M1UND4_CYAM1|nr:similar to mitochondrial inner membrane protease IMP1 [Cyanidioschyzon merolae strain 10D]BAM78891.1 similar to mitochondrial inner membrane protease IMP1 [Cyanidioschyzon merolae strain 10D]|eukprot:XP_005535177.1 similar to mitochondrial inner membrane protease IMP1 [Cyanidioschyzon merolae strain 10D]